MLQKMISLPFTGEFSTKIPNFNKFLFPNHFKCYLEAIQSIKSGTVHGERIPSMATPKVCPECLTVMDVFGHYALSCEQKSLIK